MDQLVTTQDGRVIESGDEVWSGRDAYTFQYVSQPARGKLPARVVVTDGWGSIEMPAPEVGLALADPGNTDGM